MVKVNSSFIKVKCLISRGPDLPRSCCTKYRMLILMKITEIIATRCHILKLKCIKFLGLRLRPRWELTALL